MVAERKRFIETTCIGVTRTNFCKSKCATKANDATEYPCAKEQPHIACLHSYIPGCFENAHTDHQAYDDHGQVEPAKAGLDAHCCNVIKLLCRGSLGMEHLLQHRE